jgi:N-acetylglucosamine kinase-like BadF-type ATPase
MILIADGGSTKTTWNLLKSSDDKFLFETEGYHPFFVESTYITNSLKKNLPEEIKNDALKVKQIFFYSAGGGYSEETDNVLVRGISEIFSTAEIVIETDLIAAARSLLGNSEGFAAILGTGTNSCIYDGKNIVANIESLGFLLGDEGSGSYIGKKIIGDYIRDVMPETVRETFFKTYKLSPIELLNTVYEHSVANRYCASFARFAGEHIDEDPYYFNLINQSFDDFFENIVTKYPGYEKYSFNCIGSIAFYFSSVLKQVAAKHGMKIGKIEIDAMSGLIIYHQHNI